LWYTHQRAGARSTGVISTVVISVREFRVPGTIHFLSSDTMTIELHFQDGFSGESIEVLVDGEVWAAFSAKTRYQINLAHIETVDLKHGQCLAVRLNNSGDTIELPIDANSRYFIITKKLEQMIVKQTDTMPEYL